MYEFFIPLELLLPDCGVPWSAFHFEHIEKRWHDVREPNGAFVRPKKRNQKRRGKGRERERKATEG
jgi:hypothetical protein